MAECWAGSVTREEYFRHLSQAGFTEVNVLSESAPYEKGSIEVVSFTISGTRAKGAAAAPRNRRRKEMKSLIRPRKVAAASVAQCCAKISPIVAGCHD